jgi:hypothetical protein
MLYTFYIIDRVDFVLLHVLLEEILHHLIILIEEDSDVVMLAPVVVQELVRLDGAPCHIPLLLHLGLLDESVLASLGGIGCCRGMFLLI